MGLLPIPLASVQGARFDMTTGRSFVVSARPARCSAGRRARILGSARFLMLVAAQLSIIQRNKWTRRFSTQSGGARCAPAAGRPLARGATWPRRPPKSGRRGTQARFSFG